MEIGLKDLWVSKKKKIHTQNEILLIHNLRINLNTNKNTNNPGT